MNVNQIQINVNQIQINVNQFQINVIKFKYFTNHLVHFIFLLLLGPYSFLRFVPFVYFSFNSYLVYCLL